MMQKFLATLARGSSLAFLNLILLVSFALGIAGLAYGSWLIYEPAGFLVGGAIATVVPVLYARGAWLASSKQ